VVTAANMFFRSLGSAVGVAVFGAVVNGTLGTVSVDGHVPPGPLTDAVHLVFVGTVAVAVLMLVAVACMPPDRRTATAVPVPPEAQPVATAE
jgi:hypothetical protein